MEAAYLYATLIVTRIGLVQWEVSTSGGGAISVSSVWSHFLRTSFLFMAFMAGGSLFIKQSNLNIIFIEMSFQNYTPQGGQHYYII